MAKKKNEDDDKESKKKQKTKVTKTSSTKNAEESQESNIQPPPPDLEGTDGEVPWDHEHDKKHKHHGHEHHIDHEAAEVIYRQLLEVRKTVDTLVHETKEAKLRKNFEQVPVRTSDLMRGFQAAVARANRAERSDEEDGEDIERMSIKDLEISLSAPIIEGGHAGDPVLMLPNIKSADAQSAAVSLKFTIVSVPAKQRG